MVERLPYEQQIAIEQGMLRTGRWQSIDNQPDWTRMRTRWHVFQGVRSILLLAAFILLAIEVATD